VLRPACVAQSAAVAAEHCESDRDPCVVVTEGLATIVNAFVARHRAQYPLTSPYDEISARTYGEVPPAAIRKVASRSYRMTEMRVADAIIAAVGRPDAFNNGELEVMGNPRVPAARRAAAGCCGGSLTGTIDPV
jgi:hypothetical protein